MDKPAENRFLYIHRVLPDDQQLPAFGPDADNAITVAQLRGLFAEQGGGRVVNFEAILSGEAAASAIGGYGLTFDDGYRDFAEVVLPVLEEHGVRVLLFVTTAFVEQASVPYEYRVAELIAESDGVWISPSEWVDVRSNQDKAALYRRLISAYKRFKPEKRERTLARLFELNGVPGATPGGPAMLNREEVVALDGHPLVEIGAHTHRHPYLPSVGWGEAWREIAGCKHRLEAMLGHPVEYFAYPYGGHTRMIKWLSKRAGYRYIFTTRDTSGSGAVAFRADAVPRTDVTRVLRARG